MDEGGPKRVLGKHNGLKPVRTGLNHFSDTLMGLFESSRSDTTWLVVCPSHYPLLIPDSPFVFPGRCSCPTPSPTVSLMFTERLPPMNPTTTVSGIDFGWLLQPLSLFPDEWRSREARTCAGSRQPWSRSPHHFDTYAGASATPSLSSPYNNV